MTQGKIPDCTPTNLQEKILLEDAKNQPGVEIIGGTELHLEMLLD